jgi:hypothetical protein
MWFIKINIDIKKLFDEDEIILYPYSTFISMMKKKHIITFNFK